MSVPEMGKDNRELKEPVNMQEAKEYLEAEAKNWARLNMDPNNIQINTFKMNCFFVGVSELLIEKGFFTEEELEFVGAKNMLENLRDARIEYESELRKARIMTGIRSSPIIGANGLPIDLKDI